MIVLGSLGKGREEDLHIPAHTRIQILGERELGFSAERERADRVWVRYLYFAGTRVEHRNERGDLHLAL